MYQVILASESPRRKEIMGLFDIPFEVITANVEEVVTEKVPSEMVQAIAKLKTEAVLISDRLQREGQKEIIMIGADTMVFCDGMALGKPKNEEDAVRMLLMLSDNTHEVYTGVSIIIRDKAGMLERISFAVATKVVVLPLTMEQIKDYIATGEPMDKAGAYAIQGKFGVFIKEIIGDYYNVVGFPASRIYETLLQKGIDLKKIK